MKKPVREETSQVVSFVTDWVAFGNAQEIIRRPGMQEKMGPGQDDQIRTERRYEAKWRREVVNELQ